MDTRKERGRLSLTFLTASETPAFRIVEEGTTVTVTRLAEGEVTLSPDEVLRDIHAIFDAPLGPYSQEGKRFAMVGGSLVRENWANRQLRHRSYQATEGQGDVPRVSIAYDGFGPDALPAVVTLKHHPSGYTLRIASHPG